MRDPLIVMGVNVLITLNRPLGKPEGVFHRHAARGAHTFAQFIVIVNPCGGDAVGRLVLNARDVMLGDQVNDDAAVDNFHKFNLLCD